MSELAETSPFESAIRSARPKLILGAVVLGVLWLAWLGFDLARLGFFSGRLDVLEARSPALLFGAWVILPIAVLAAAARQGYHAWLRMVAHPDEPWLWSGRWNPAGERPAVLTRLRTPFQAALALSGLLALLTALVVLPLGGGGLPRWLLVPAGVIALAAWGWVAVEAVRAFWFRGSCLRFGTFPFFLGERVTGELEGFSRFRDFTKITLSLRCLKTRRDRARISDLASSQQSLVWETRRELRPGDVDTGGGDETTLPVDLPLPETIPGLKPDDRSPSWELAVEAERPGPNYRATFELPVYPRRGA